MRLLVDTNRFIAALIRDSISRRIIMEMNAELIVIPFMEREVEKYKPLIMQKTGMDEFELELLIDILNAKMIVLSEEAVTPYMSAAEEIMDKIDPDDTFFIAAALATGADIWSDDEHFQKQNRIKVWKTKDLMKQF